MKKKISIIFLTVFVTLLFFSVPVFAEPEAAPDEAIIMEETAAREEPAVPEAITVQEEIITSTETPLDPPVESPATTARPFTPPGAGTVTDTATDADGKEFYTIMTPDEHIFYLVIDKQRGTENVYFLNAVTVSDLMALAQMPETPPVMEPQNLTTAITGLSAADAPEPEREQKQNNGMGTIIFIMLIIIIGGGAGWYFKIYRPKQQAAIGADEADYSMEYEAADDWGGQEPENDSLPWDENDE